MLLLPTLDTVAPVPRFPSPVRHRGRTTRRRCPPRQAAQGGVTRRRVDPGKTGWVRGQFYLSSLAESVPAYLPSRARRKSRQPSRLDLRRGRLTHGTPSASRRDLTDGRLFASVTLTRGPEVLLPPSLYWIFTHKARVFNSDRFCRYTPRTREVVRPSMMCRGRDWCQYTHTTPRPSSSTPRWMTK